MSAAEIENFETLEDDDRLDDDEIPEGEELPDDLEDDDDVERHMERGIDSDLDNDPYGNDPGGD